MQSLPLEISFDNYDRQCIKFLKILREIQSNFSKNVNVIRCELGFQLENKCLHVYTAQQGLTQSHSNSVFMMATFKQGFYKVQNYKKPVAFGVRLRGFISKLLICKKEQIDQIKFTVTDQNLVFNLCDKNSKGWISHSMMKIPLELKQFDYNERLNVLIDIAEVKQDWMEKNKKGKLPENLNLLEDRIELQTVQKNYICGERSLKFGRDLTTYNSEGIFKYYGREDGRVRVKMLHSICKHISFYKGLGIDSFRMKLFEPKNPINGEPRLFLEMENSSYVICKTFACEIARGQMDEEVVFNAPNTIRNATTETFSEKKRRLQANLNHFKIEQQEQDNQNENEHQHQYQEQYRSRITPKGNKRDITSYANEIQQQNSVEISYKMSSNTGFFEPAHNRKIKEKKEEASRSFIKSSNKQEQYRIIDDQDEEDENESRNKYTFVKDSQY